MTDPVAVPAAVTTAKPAASTGSPYTGIGVAAIALLVIAFLLPLGGEGIGGFFAGIARGAAPAVNLVENSKVTMITIGVGISIFFLTLVGVALAIVSVIKIAKK